MNCPDCLKELKDGCDGMKWCICGYKWYPPGFKRKRDHDLLSSVFPTSGGTQ